MATISPDLQALIKATCAKEVQSVVASSQQAAIDNYIKNGTFHVDLWNSELNPLRKNLNTFFLLIMGYFIYYMDVGFMLLEVGMIRSKNVSNALLKNVTYSFTQALGFWVFGYAIAFGKSVSHFVGSTYWGWMKDPDEINYAYWFFQYVFACTSGAIVTGAIAERAQLLGYVIYTLWASAFSYPFVVSWAWNDEGWLKLGGTYNFNGESVTVGFEDFAGSGVVHICGASATLAYLLVLGPRIGRFEANGKSNEMPAHNATLITIGAMILFTGFLAFNSGSLLSVTNPGDFLPIGRAAANTVLCGTGGYLCVFISYRVIYKRWLLIPSVCGGLAGCVGACANCNIVEGWGAFCIGIFAGLFFMGLSWLLRRCQIDDAVDAVPVHWGGGFAGIVGLAFFKIETGIFFAWNDRSGYMLAWQLCGVVVITAWAFVNTYILCLLLKMFNLLRVDRDTEITGLDVGHGHEECYPANAGCGCLKGSGLPTGPYPRNGTYHPWPGKDKDWSLLDLSSLSTPVRRRYGAPPSAYRLEPAQSSSFAIVADHWRISPDSAFNNTE